MDKGLVLLLINGLPNKLSLVEVPAVYQELVKLVQKAAALFGAEGLWLCAAAAEERVDGLGFGREFNKLVGLGVGVVLGVANKRYFGSLAVGKVVVAECCRQEFATVLKAWEVTEEGAVYLCWVICVCWGVDK